MAEIGYTLSSEEFGPRDLVRYAQRAEAAGFPYALVSDHFHPWIDRQGHSPFVWSVIGAVGAATERLRLGTGVTCPTMRVHPAIVAQAAATSAALMPGRFFLGVGTGENLNEHVTGARWPEIEVRLDMLEEAVAVIRSLWEGGSKSHHGTYYTVENARIYTLPDEPPPIYVAASGPKAAALAGRIGDGFISTGPDRELMNTFEKAGGTGPRFAQMTVCWADDEQHARKIAFEHWPTSAVPGELGQELPVPAHFEQVSQLVTEEAIGKAIVCGPDPQRYVEKVRAYEKAGFDHVYLHQVGPDQDGFFEFWERELRAKLTRSS